MKWCFCAERQICSDTDVTEVDVIRTTLGPAPVAITEITRLFGHDGPSLWAEASRHPLEGLAIAEQLDGQAGDRTERAAAGHRVWRDRSAAILPSAVGRGDASYALVGGLPPRTPGPVGAAVTDIAGSESGFALWGDRWSTSVGQADQEGSG